MGAARDGHAHAIEQSFLPSRPSCSSEINIPIGPADATARSLLQGGNGAENRGKKAPVASL